MNESLNSFVECNNYKYPLYTHDTQIYVANVLV